MTSTVPPEIRMTNDIAAAFRHLPEEQAAKAIAEHLHKFWDPRMRSRLSECVDAGAEGLVPVAVAAVQRMSRPHRTGTG